PPAALPAHVQVAAPPPPAVPAPIPIPEPSASAPRPASPPPLSRAPAPESWPGLDEPAPKPTRRGMSGGLVAALAMLVVAGLGFAAIELFDLKALVTGGSTEDRDDVGEERAAVAPAVEKVDEPPALVDPFPAIARYYGERREGIVDRGVKVPEGQGLVIVEKPTEGPPAEVLVGDESLGKTPLAKAFPAGRVEITLVRGSEKTFRYVF